MSVSELIYLQLLKIQSTQWNWEEKKYQREVRIEPIRSGFLEQHWAADPRAFRATYSLSLLPTTYRMAKNNRKVEEEMNPRALAAL